MLALGIVTGRLGIRIVAYGCVEGVLLAGVGASVLSGRVAGSSIVFVVVWTSCPYFASWWLLSAVSI